MKRLFDFLTALIALVLLAPALAAIALAIWLDDRRSPSSWPFASPVEEAISAW